MSTGLPVLQKDNYLLSIGRRMPRERRQFGWVKKTGKTVKTWTGYWYVYLTVDGVEKRRERSKVLGRCSEITKGLAEDELIRVIRGWKPPQIGATFGEIAVWYLKTNEGLWGHNWYVTVHAMFQIHILPLLGHHVAEKLKRSEIQQALNAIAANTKTQSQSFVSKCLTQLRAVYNFAIDDDLLERNPALKLEMPPTREADQRFVSLPICKKLLEVGESRTHLIIRVFMVCGLRPSELFALRVNDIFDGELRIDETIVKGKVTGKTKTKNSRGNVPLSPDLESALRFYALNSGMKDEDFLFPSSAGTATLHDNFLDRVLQPHGELAGIPGLTHQMLRRTTATHFQKHGTVKDTQTLLRHSDAQTTLRHYQKVLDDSLRSGVSKWDEELVSATLMPSRQPRDIEGVLKGPTLGKELNGMHTEKLTSARTVT